MEAPPSMKSASRYLTLAKQIEKAVPRLAYFCRLYAIEVGMASRDPNKPEDTAFLGYLMDELETAKAVIPTTVTEPEADAAFVLQFALKAFKTADDEDRAGLANKKTARNYMNAYLFFDVASQFVPLSDEHHKLNVYAKHKTLQISSYLARGEKPPAGDGSMDIMDSIPEVPNADAGFGGPAGSSAVPSVPDVPVPTFGQVTSPAPVVPTPSPPPASAPKSAPPTTSSAPVSPPSTSPPPTVTPSMFPQSVSPPPSSSPTASNQDFSHVQRPQSAPQQPPSHQQVPQYQPPAVVAPVAARPTSAPVVSSNVGIGGDVKFLTPELLARATQEARHILSSLQFEDAATAVRHAEILIGLLRK